MHDANQNGKYLNYPPVQQNIDTQHSVQQQKHFEPCSRALTVLN